MKKKAIFAVGLSVLLVGTTGCFGLFDDDDYGDDYYGDGYYGDGGYGNDDGYYGDGDYYGDSDYYGDGDYYGDSDYYGDDYDSSNYSDSDYDDDSSSGGLFSLLFGWLFEDDDSSGSSYGSSSGSSYSYTGGSGDYSDYDQYSYGGDLGSAKEMDGTSVIVSIYLNDSNTSWDFSNSTDTTTRTNTLYYLGMATDWLTAQVANYGVTSSFIYDWAQCSDLYYEGSVDCDMTDDNSDSAYYAQMEWIDDNIDSQTIMDAHSADNIIYMLFINTSYDNDCVSSTYNYSEYSEYPYEVVSIYVRSDGEDEAPAAYAHEILHTFGAPDLYTADEYGDNYGITQEYVNSLENSYSNDIMFTTYDCETQESYYNYISNEFTEIDAYYVGVTDYSADVEEWGFDKSQHSN